MLKFDVAGVLVRAGKEVKMLGHMIMKQGRDGMFQLHFPVCCRILIAQ